MDKIEHGDEAEIAAFIPHGLGQPCLKHRILDTTPQGAVPETPDRRTHEREGLSTNPILGMFFHYHPWIQNLTLTLPVNVSGPKKEGLTEQLLETRRAIKRRWQGMPWSKEPSESTFPTPGCS